MLKFLTAKGENQPESIEKTDVLTHFVRTNKVVYNKKCVTFYLTKDTVEVWKKEFERWLGSLNLFKVTRATRSQEYSINRIQSVSVLCL